jgi:nickel-dependent lactate racemase
LKISIPYGRTEKVFYIDRQRLLLNLSPKLPNRPKPEEETVKVEEALENPLGARPIEELAGTGDKVAILVDDWTRPTPSYKIAPAILRRLMEAGVRQNDIRFIVARGTHDSLSRSQMRAKLGDAIVERYRVDNHNPGGPLVELGTTGRGTPILVNRALAEADLIISIGGICTHPIAGYGGGAKIILPGVSGFDTINVNHSMADSSGVALGVADNNPVREDMEEAARRAGLNFIVNVILNQSGEIIEAVAGDLLRAHRAGVDLYKKIYGAEVTEEAEIVVLGASPRDATVYHSAFALPCALSAVKEGGVIILVSQCFAGPGKRLERKAYREAISLNPNELMRMIKEGEIPASSGVFNWVTSKVIHRNRVILVSDNLSQQDVEEYGFSYGASVQKAVDEALETAGGRVTVIPTGGLMVPLSKGSAGFYRS